MRWTLTRIIWLRELRDQLRDRRTIVMIIGLPIVLYPLMGITGYFFALGAVEQPSAFGIVGLDALPALSAKSAGFSPVPTASWLATTPVSGIDGFAGAVLLVQASRLEQDYPPLIVDGTFPRTYFEYPVERDAVSVEALPDASRGPLVARRIDLMLVVRSNFREELDAGRQPVIDLYTREADERSRLAERRVKGVLARWKKGVQDVRLRKRGLPSTFDDPVAVRSPGQDGGALKQTTEELSDMVARFFPFMIIMWSMAGALYPAIDVSAGEKERGTLETLLLSPAARGEIVGGKYLAVWVFSAGTALWNLAWLGGGAYASSYVLPFAVLPLSSFLWCAVLTSILAALFSALSLALGTYARSTKEGQYYLLPLFLVTMPLTFLPMLPGVELNLAWSLVPITGAVLLLQNLMSAAPQPGAWLYLGPVLLSVTGSVLLALRWAAAQFQREDVLFRDSPGLSLGTQLRRLLGRKRA